MTILLALLLAQLGAGGPQPGPAQPGVRVPAPTTWVAFSAELKITHPSRPLAFGRQLQDEHGCLRRETVNPDGSLMVTIHNYENATSYSLMRGSWTSSAIRLFPDLPRRPPASRVVKFVRKIEGFDAYLSVVNVTSPRGNYTQERLVIPALNFFVAEQTHPNGDTITAQNIRLATPDHAEFLPPPGAAIGEQAGVRAGQFSAVVVRIAFAERPPVELTTTEEKPMDLRTHADETLQIVTTVVDDARNLVRVRIMKNAEERGLGNVIGDVLDEVQVALGGTVQTTKLPENFSVSVTRIRDRRAAK